MTNTDAEKCVGTHHGCCLGGGGGSSLQGAEDLRIGSATQLLQQAAHAGRGPADLQASRIAGGQAASVELSRGEGHEGKSMLVTRHVCMSACSPSQRTYCQPGLVNSQALVQGGLASGQVMRLHVQSANLCVGAWHNAA